MPAAINAITSAQAARPGQRKFRRKLSVDVRRHAKRGPTPVRNSRNNPIGIINRLNQAGTRLIFSPDAYSVMMGNVVPHSTEKQLARRIRLLNRKLDTSETTLSSSASLFR